MLLAAMILQASVVAPIFAPPTDAPLRIVTERTETSVNQRQYRFERLVRFTRETAGYRAEVVVLGSTSEAPQALGELVEHGLSTLAGRAIVLHLDDTGKAIAVDDMAVLWDRVCQGIAAAGVARPGLPTGNAPALSAKLAAALRGLPPERQRDLLATLVTAIVSSEPLDTVGIVTPVKLPGASPFGAPVILEGTRRAVRADGLLRTTTTAFATMTLPARNGTPEAPGAVSLERVRSVDPRTGMIASGLDTLRNVTGSGATARETLLVTRLRVERAPPADWPD
jgi:hypothetical protein